MKLTIPSKLELQDVWNAEVSLKSMDEEMEDKGIGVLFVENVSYVKKVLSDLVISINFTSLSWVE